MNRSASTSPTMTTGLTIFYDDNPNAEMASQGLHTFPLIGAAAGVQELQYWMMSPSEQVALLFLLEHLRPKVSIEIGTRFGGSLQVLSRFSERVYSLDIDPEVPKRLEGKFSNVEYIIGPSDKTLPLLIERLEKEHAEVGFALVDGDHSTAGVRADIDALLKFKPTVPLHIVMHDSFNPACRLGLRKANWAGSPYVHAVELDFVAGIVNPSPFFRDQLWGGLALGILYPEPRQGRFEVTARSERTYVAAEAAHAKSRSLVNRGARKLKRLLTQ